MATDAEVLTAAREFASASAAVRAEDAAKARADAEVGVCATRCNDARKRLGEVQQRLLQLSSQKPAEPAPKPEPPAAPAPKPAPAPAPAPSPQPSPAPHPAPAPAPSPSPGPSPSTVPNLPGPKRRERAGA